MTNLGVAASDSTFVRCIVSNEWVGINTGNESSLSAQLTGGILNVGLMSCQFWRDNSAYLFTDDYTPTYTYVPDMRDQSTLVAYNAREIVTNSASEIYYDNDIVRPHGPYYNPSEDIAYRKNSIVNYRLKGPNMYILPWVGADIAEAIIGGAVGAARQYASAGHVTVGNTLVSIGIGAVMASTGIVGRFGRAITSWFS